MEKTKIGRPLAKIGKQEFEGLCELQCTAAEISGFFKCHPETLATWCKREYGESFNEVFKMYRAPGMVSLRRIQMKLAETNAAMGIFLGKNILGQRDSLTLNMSNENEDDPITKSIKEGMIARGELERDDNEEVFIDRDNIIEVK